MKGELRLEHEGCEKCTVAVRAQRGSRVITLYDRRNGRTILTARVVSDEGAWLGDAIARASDHARDGAK